MNKSQVAFAIRHPILGWWTGREWLIARVDRTFSSHFLDAKLFGDQVLAEDVAEELEARVVPVEFTFR